MARKIETAFTLSGETEYKRSIKEISSEQTTLNAELRKVDNQMKLHGTTQEGLRDKARVLNQQVGTQQERIDVLNEKLAEANQLYPDGGVEVDKYTKQLHEAERFMDGYKKQLEETNAALADNENKLKQAGQALQQSGQDMQETGKKLTVGLTTPILGIGAAATAAWSEYDEAIDAIALSSGAGGDALAELEDTYRKVFGNLPVESAKVADAVGELNTQFGWTGKALDEATERMVKYSEITGQDVIGATQGAKGIIEAYGLEYEDLYTVLDQVAVASQNTGADTSALMGQMVKAAPQIKDLGLTTGEAAFLMGELGQHGLDASNVLGGLTRAQVTGAKSGKDLNAVLAEFAEFAESGASETEVLNRASELFGTRRGPVMIEALQRGALDFDGLAESAAQAGGTVENTFENILDPVDQAKVAMNNFKLAGADLGTAIQIGAAPALDWLADKAKGVADAFRDLDTEQQQFIVTLGAGLAAVGPATAGIGKLTEGIGKMMERAAGAADGTSKLSAALGGGGKMALIGVAVAVTAALVNYYESLRAIDEETQALLDSSASAREAFEGQMSAIDDNAVVSDRLIGRLQELESQTELTAEEQAEMHGIMSSLNDLYPDLNLQIDEETGLLNLNAEAIRSAASAHEDRLRLQAVNDEYLRLLKEEEEITRQLADAEADVQKLIEDGFAVYNEQTGLIEATTGNFSFQWQQMHSVIDGYNLLNDAQDENMANQAENSEKRTTLLAKEAEATEAALKAEEEAAEGVKRIWQRRVTDQERALENLTEQEREYIQTMQEQGQEQNDFLKEQLWHQKELAEEAYLAKGEAWQKEEEARFNRDAKRKADLDTWQEFEEEALRQTIANQEQYARDLDSELGNQLGILSKFADDEFKSLEASADQHYEHNKKKMEAYTSYNKNLSDLRGRVSDEMYAELVKMGPEHAGLIAEYANMTESELEKHSDQWTEIYKLTGEVAADHLETIPEVTAEVLAEQEGIIRDSSGKLYDAETEAMDYIRQAIKDKRPEASAEMEATSSAVQKAAETDLTGMGEDAVATYEEGMKNWRPKAEREAEELAYQVFMNADGSLEERGAKAVQTYVDAMAEAEIDAINQALRMAREVEVASETPLFDEGAEGVHSYEMGQKSKRRDVEKEAEEMAASVKRRSRTDLNPEGEHGATTYAAGIRNKIPQSNRAAKDMADQAQRNARKSLYADGANAGQSFADGIKSKTWHVSQAGSGLGQTLQNSLRSNLQIYSPSRVTTGLAHDTGDGFVLGLEEKIKDVEKAAGRMGDAAQIMGKVSVTGEVIGGSQYVGTHGGAGQLSVDAAVDSQLIADAVTRGLAGMGVYMDGRLLGQMIAKQTAAGRTAVGDLR